MANCRREQSGRRALILGDIELSVCIPPEMNKERESGSETDDALLQMVGRGDHDAFLRFYNRFASPLYSMIFEMVGDRTEAEDLLLEGMEEIWRRAQSFDPSRSAAFTWCVMIIRSRSIDRLRKKSTRSRTLQKVSEETMDSADPELYEWKEERDIVRRVIESMDENRGALLKLAFFEGLTHQEISDKTGKPLGTVKSTIRRSLLELRGLITKEGYER